jgi:molecular chaperone IbpA
MRSFDLTPLWRSTIGFDRLFDLMNEATRWNGEETHPPYNIERTGEDRYQIALALAGFDPDEITITAGQNVLTVEGRKKDDASDRQYSTGAFRHYHSGSRSISPTMFTLPVLRSRAGS